MLSLIAVVLAVTVTVAQDNFISLEQAANTANNDAVVNQNADGADAYINQRGGNGNQVDITQDGVILDQNGDPFNSVSGPTGNFVDIEQVGSRNDFTSNQRGVDNRVKAFQRGTGNTAEVENINYVNDGDRVNLRQDGDRNSFTARTEGNRTRVQADQKGDDNTIDYFGNGGASNHEAILNQRGDFNTMDVNQDGSRQFVDANQNGVNNDLITTQGGQDNTIFSTQGGTNNSATLNQNAVNNQ